MPFFSIIVPVYNVEKYLEQCIDSVLNQTFRDFELILVDDGSTDNSPDLCKQYATKDIRVSVLNKENGGASSARNYGLDNAKGRYVMFLDSDDFYNSIETLEVINKKLLSSSADVLLFGCTDYNEVLDKTIISRTGYNIELIEKGNSEDTLHYLLSQKMIPGGPTIFCTARNLIEKTNIRFKTGIQDEDYDFVLNVFINADSIYAIDNPFYTYRHGRSGSVTSQSSVKMVEGIEYTINKWLKIADDIDNEVLKKDLLNYLAFIYTTGFVVSGNMSKDNRKKAIRILKNYSYILRYGYWKKTIITKYAIKIFGLNLFSIISKYYFNATHIQR